LVLSKPLHYTCYVSLKTRDYAQLKRTKQKGAPKSGGYFKPISTFKLFI